jgi:hypothetical protein
LKLFNFSNFCFLVSIHIHNDQVFIEQLGTNTSFINQLPIVSNDKQIINDGDILHLLENEHEYTVSIERTVANNQLTKASTPVKRTLKRQNTNDDEISPKKQKVPVNKMEEGEGEERKETLDDESIDESFEENRLVWIQQQLDALQANAKSSYVFQ